jgi:uncharacterized YkwD family protein
MKMKKSAAIVLLCVMLLLSMSSSAFAFGKGTQGPDVYAVQGMLKSMGYYAGPITGYYGSQTEAGVKYFQQKYGLPQTGAIDDRTLQSILWAYANIKIPKQQPKQPQVEIPPAKVPGLSAEEQKMVNLVNEARKQNGLPALAVDLELSKVARVKSQDMVTHNYFSHQSPTYGSPFDMMKKFGINYTAAGENIACNQEVTAAHQALMNSQGHRENILSTNFTHIGVGIVEGGKCGKMFTQLFIKK